MIGCMERVNHLVIGCMERVNHQVIGCMERVNHQVIGYMERVNHSRMNHQVNPTNLLHGSIQPIARPRNGAHALMVTPHRALAVQIADDVTAF